MTTGEAFTRRTVAALRHVTASPASLQFAWWYVAILLPTLVFKARYLDMAYSGGLDALIAPLVAEANGLPRWAYRPLFFTADFLEVFVLVASIFVVGHLLLRVRAEYLMLPSVFLSILVAAATNRCQWETGSLLTPDVLRIAVHWAAGHLEILPRFVTPRTVMVLPVALVWSIAPILLSRRKPGGPHGSLGWWTPRVVIASVIVAALVHVGFISTEEASPSPQRGYWSNVATTFLDLKDVNPLHTPAPPVSAIQESYLRLAFPAGMPADPSYLVDVPEAARKPRHIVIVSLETAPRKYYPITSASDLPVFHRMTRHALVSDRHYTAALWTVWAIYSMLSGTYPRQAGSLLKYGDFETDGLATVLARRGYETTYIDASVIHNWDSTNHYERMVRDLGFSTLFETPGTWVGSSWERYKRQVEAEEHSFDRALRSVTGAAGRGRRALVCIATAFGHFPWRAQPGDEALPPKQKLFLIGQLFDRLLGRLLQSLESNGLGNEVIIVVTGDHGLRFQMEFESVREEARHGDMAFNVPLLIYAPSLFPSQVRLPYLTSHIDITPTLLHLTGVRHDTGLHHGGHLLDRRLRDRITFLMNGGVGLVDGFHWRGYFYTRNNLTGQVTVRRDEAVVDDEASGASESAPLSDRETRATLRTASEVFDRTAAHFLQRQYRGKQN